ncbi:MAG: hypothetical protein ACI82F_001732, partial [Planctomycetota bacterium]
MYSVHATHPRILSTRSPAISRWGIVLLMVLGGLGLGLTGVPLFASESSPVVQEGADKPIVDGGQGEDTSVPLDATPIDAAAAQQPDPISEGERSLLWRAGAGPIAGLGAARRGERQAERSSAIAKLSTLLASGSDRRPQLLGELEQLLLQTSDDRAWCSAARAVGATGIYDLAPLLVAQLENPGSPQRQLCAREGLRSLYGRWFANEVEAAPYVAGVQPGDGTNLLVQSALDADERAVGQELARLRLQGQDLARFLSTEHLLQEERYLSISTLLGAPDGRLRSGAADLIAALARATENAELRIALWGQLETHMLAEVDPLVFEHFVDLLVDGLFTRSVAEDQLEAVRADLAILAKTVEPARALAVAHGLARLPWSYGASADAADGTTGRATLGDAMGTIGGLLDRLNKLEQGDGPREADLLLGTISATQVLLSPEDLTASLDEEGAGILRLALRGVLSSRGRASSSGTSIAALVPYVRLVQLNHEDWLLGQIDDDATGPAYAYALLGALAPRFLNSAPSPGPGQVSVNGTVFVARVASLFDKTTDTDLQKRALGLLADERLATFVDRAFGRVRGTSSGSEDANAGGSTTAGSSADDAATGTDGDPGDAATLVGASADSLAQSLLTLLAAPETTAEMRG